MNRLEIAARIAAGAASGLSPLNIAEFSLTMADALIKLEAETRPETEVKPDPEELPFKMALGGVYEMRNGETEEIVEERHYSVSFRFTGLSGRRYNDAGACYQETSCDSFDLIKRIR